MFPTIWWRCSLGLLAFGLAEAQTAPVRYVITPLQGLSSGYQFGSAFAGPHGLAQDGTVVGATYDANSNASVAAFTGNKVTTYGTLGGQGATSTGVNNLGVIVGGVQNPAGLNQAFVLAGGVTTLLGFLPGGARSIALGINDAGQIIGTGNSSSAFGERGFLYDHGGMIDLGDLGGGNTRPSAINRLGQIVGSSEGPGSGASFGPILAFVYENGQMRPLPGFGGSYSRAQDINSSGQVVGSSEYPGSGRRHACRWRDGILSDLGALGSGLQSEAYAINDQGEIVGTSEITPAGAATAFLLSGGRMYDLDLLVEPWNSSLNVFPNTNDRLLEADAISSTGTILALSNSLGLVRLDPVTSGRISNFSVRGRTDASGHPLTLGVAWDGDTAGRVLFRGIGPGLATFGIATRMTAPRLNLYQGATWLQSIAGWNSADARDASSVGAFPITAGSSDAAAIQTLSPGVYTVQATPSTAGPGVTLLEAYAFQDSAPTPRFANASALVSLGDGESTPIAGFSVSGAYGTSVLLRVVGQGLSQFGVPDGAPAPQVTLFDSSGAVVGRGTPASPEDAVVANLLSSLGAFESRSAAGDMLIIASLRPGTYSAVISDRSGASGTVLFEMYEL